MKKALIVTLVIVLIVLLCGGIYFGLIDGTRIKDSVLLPDEYYIEYEVLGEDSTISVIAKGKDSAGNYYYKSAGSETVFILEGDKYIVYDRQNGEWIERAIYVNSDYIESNTQTFKNYTDKSTEAFGDIYTQGDDKSYLSRNCESYEMGLGIFGQKYEMLIDKDSGICLSFFEMSSFDAEDSARAGFKCVKFETANLNFLNFISSEK